MSATAYERLRDALESHGSLVRDTGHGRFSAQCPAHPDRNPSLSVTAIEGKSLIHCHAGCDKAEVLAALNLTMRDLFDNPKGAEYVYPGGHRTVLRTPDKQFRQKVTGTDRALFRGDRLDGVTHVLVVEGEQDVLAAEAVGATAVCSAMGAGKAHLADWEPLRGKHVTVVTDDDAPGRKHADQVVEHVLAAGAADARIVRAAVGKDLADHIAAGRTIQDLIEEKPAQAAEATTWEAFDLGPWLTGTVQRPQPTVGLPRTDGQKTIYPGREHAVVGETESGKSWFALGCVATELCLGNTVVYIHYEESDPGSTVERLLLLGVAPADIAARLRFVAPARPAHSGWLAALLTDKPVLVVHDGVNEAMSLHGADIMAADGASAFRRALIKPCLAAGAAVLSCDHVPKNVEGRGRDAYGSVHKGNALDGARIVLENVEPFGRGLRGRSYVFITKDRPGQLRAHGKPTKVSGKTFYGTLVVDDSPLSGPDFLAFYAPRDESDDERLGDNVAAEAKLADAVLDIVTAKPDRQIESVRMLMAELRNAGYRIRDGAVRSAVDDLIVTGRLVEVEGKRGAKGLRVVSSASRSDFVETPDVSATASASPLRGGRGTQSHTSAADAVGRSRIKRLILAASATRFCPRTCGHKSRAATAIPLHVSRPPRR